MNFKNLLNKFDSINKKNFDENDISSALKSYIPEDKDLIDEDLKAEIMAFDFVENYPDQKSGWGTYFGPMFVWSNADGTSTESPSIQLITPNIIDYWEKRSTECNNPILKTRYIGLVWDFKNRITGKNPTHENCRMYIEGLNNIANGDFHKYEVNTICKLERALNLAIGLNDSKLIEIIKNSILSFEERHSEDFKPGLWGYAFDLLVEKKLVNLPEAEENNIINELENKLARLTIDDNEKLKVDPWAAEAAAERLAVYYRKKQKTHDVKRVLLEIGKAYKKIIKDASSMQAYGWLDHLHKLFLKFNLKKEADELLIEIRTLGIVTANDLKTTSHIFELPKDKMDEYISAMTIGSPEEILFRIATQYIPIKAKVKEQIFDLSKTAPTIFIIPQKIQDEKGRIVATIGSLEQDLEGHIVRQISQNLSFSALFIRAVLNEAISQKGLSKFHILKFLDRTPIINTERKIIIDKALDAYFQNEYLIFIHLIIPQIEEAIRNLLELSDGPVIKHYKDGKYSLRTLDDILRDNLILEALGEDFTDYLRILLTDQRGWNIRNMVCHGIASPKLFNQQTADRILHSLIILGLICEE